MRMPPARPSFPLRGALVALSPLLAVAALRGADAARGGAAAPDKRAYSFAHPTPDALLRELSTDRPDATESPFTVDAGHVQIEMDAVAFSRERADGDRSTEWGVAPCNLRLGLRHNLEAGIFVAPWVRIAERPAGGRETATSGAGDLTLRLKYNFWGNDGGPTAAGIFFDAKLPTARRGLGNGRLEGAVTLPVAFELAGGWEGAGMTVAELVYTGADGYRPVWRNTITFGHDLAEGLGGFVELTSSAGDGAHAATFNAGLAFRTDRNTQFDCGVNLGLSRAAPDAGIFIGLSRRF